MLSQKLQKDLMNAYAAVHEEKRGHAAGDSDVEKQASQLASDVRYKAKGKVKPGASDEEKKKVFIQILGSSPAPNAVKAMAKQKLMGEEVVVEMSAKETLDKKMKQKKVNTIIKKEAQQDAKAEKKLADAVMGEGSSYGMYKGDGMSFPERLKKKAEEKKKQKKKKMSEEKKPLPKNKMYRKAGNLARQSISTGFHTPKGRKLASRSEKIVSTAEKSNVKKNIEDVGMMRNIQKNSYEPQGELVDERAELKHLNYGNAVVGQKKTQEQTTKPKKAIPTGGDGTAYVGEAKKAKKDYDGDGKVESGTQEFLGSRDKAIKKAIAKRRGRYNEGFSSWRIDLDFNEQVKK